MHKRGTLNAVDEQMPILCMMFTLQETQHVAGVSLDDIVIHTTPTHNIMGAGSAQPKPPQPGAFSGVGDGGGFGDSGFGFDGGISFDSSSDGGGSGGGGGGGIGSGGGFSDMSGN
jgi:hypothetical protein